VQALFDFSTPAPLLDASCSCIEQTKTRIQNELPQGTGTVEDAVFGAVESLLVVIRIVVIKML
jgi:hypothetical protein